ncbi:MAG: hypothetical protein JWN18_20 [Parcubacteria group bacterium]|nr:hypothetical protein [Parcubacteria group bacterium]
MKSGMRALPLLFLCVFLFSAQHTLASTTDGTVSTTDRWAWSENAGWIDFGTTAGNVHMTDSALTGYAYGENVGWISLNCSNTSSCGTNSYAVTNDGSGTLSGFAWGENTGWVDFAPSAGGVTINSSGVFSGYAYSENLGWIVFAVDHPVTTDWRVASSPSPSPTTPVVHQSRRGRGAVVCSTGLVWSSSSLKCVPTQVPVPITPTIPPSTTSIPPTAIPSHYSFLINHRIGETGEDIRILQKFFNIHGFILAISGPGSPGNETTTFGALTKAALINFQKSNDIAPAVGYFGPLTRGFINSHY